jgi:hypothetical protein
MLCHDGPVAPCDIRRIGIGGFATLRRRRTLESRASGSADDDDGSTSKMRREARQSSTEAQEEMALSRVVAAESSIQEARAAVSEAEAQIGHTKLTAPLTAGCSNGSSILVARGCASSRPRCAESALP